MKETAREGVSTQAVGTQVLEPTLSSEQRLFPSELGGPGEVSHLPYVTEERAGIRIYAGCWNPTDATLGVGLWAENLRHDDLPFIAGLMVQDGGGLSLELLPELTSIDTRPIPLGETHGGSAIFAFPRFADRLPLKLTAMLAEQTFGVCFDLPPTDAEEVSAGRHEWESAELEPAPITAPTATPETIQSHIQRWKEEHRDVPPAVYRNPQCLCIHCDGPRWIATRGEPYNLRFPHVGDTCPYCGSEPVTTNIQPGWTPLPFFDPLYRLMRMEYLHWCATCEIHL